MATMKGVVGLGGRDVEVRDDLVIPEPGPKQVMIKVAYAALCATDIHGMEGLIGGPPRKPDPTRALGHECSGVIVALGSEAGNAGLAIGDKVVCDPGSYCGECAGCKAGKRCMSPPPPTSTGCMAEFKTYYLSSVHKIPEDMSLRKAVLIEPTTCVLRAIDLTEPKTGETACLSGAGGIGMLLLRAIKRAGVASLTVIEPVEEKWDIIRELGADHIINPFKQDVKAECDKITNGLGFDYVYEASGVSAATPICLDIAGYNATVCYFAVYNSDFELPLNLNHLYRKEGRIQTVFVHKTNWPRAVRFIYDDDPVVEKIIGLELPIEEAPKAFEEFHTSKYSKIVLKIAKDL
ncbi:MAG: zinc-binding dehydrogenase [Clostridiales bacterium]|nr:zinc-binding dehydrogenase [Clostridiales bacterium]